MSALRHLVVTDSGFGGLGLCARLEAHLEAIGGAARITYVNACPADDLGYNDMATLARKTETFADALRAIERRFDPDAIVVACNTLSTLFARGVPRPSRPTTSILEIGGRLLGDALAPAASARALVLATATTAAARPFDRHLGAADVDPRRLTYRACPGLQSRITADLDGAATALALAPIAADVAAGEPFAALLLGCTHYSLAAPIFAAAFAGARILDPVVALGDRLCAEMHGDRRRPPGALEIRFVGRYHPPARELSAMQRRLEGTAPRCARALAEPIVDPSLFAIAPPL